MSKQSMAADPAQADAASAVPASGLGADAVSCRNLHVTYPGKTGTVEALRGLDLEIARGALFVLLGPNGAGKTTLMRCITGLVRPTAGSIAVLGSADGGDRARLARLGVLIENPGLYGRLSAREYLAFFASFYGLGGAGARIDGLCREFGIPLDGRPCRKLSQGNRQKLHLARSLLHRPELLLWDEPTDHLDPESQREVLGYLRSYLAGTGATALVATHRLEQMEAVGTHFGFLAHGVLRAAGARAAILGSATGPARARMGFAVPLAEADRTWLEAAFSARLAPVRDEPLAIDLEAEGLSERMPALLRAVVERGLPLASVALIRPSLADAYQRFVGDA